MDDVSPRRSVLARLGTGVVAGLTVAGCLGDDADDEETHPEPDEYPPGVSSDGLDLETLQETVEDVLHDGSFTYEGYGRQLNLGAERQEVEGIRVAADNETRIGFIVQGESPGELNDPLDAPQVEMFYAEDDQAYEVENFGTPEAVDEGFETVIDIATDHFAEVVDHVEPLEWESPDWDGSEGSYVVPAADTEGAPTTVTEATMHVDESGMPVGLVGAVALEPVETNVEISFTPDVNVERPDWVAEAF